MHVELVLVPRFDPEQSMLGTSSHAWEQVWKWNNLLLVQGVREEDLETVVSKKAGTRVIVVMGEHAGEHGKVFEKHKQSVMVQLSESREVVELDLDSVADYHGSEHDDDW